jgi:hypothetical protein
MEGSPPRRTAPRGRAMSELVLENRLTISYLGDNRVRVTAGERCFEADQRTHVNRPGGRFCPLELVAAALGT